MELNEIKDKRDKLNADMFELVSKFQKETKVNVEDIQIVFHGKDFMGVNAFQIYVSLERI